MATKKLPEKKIAIPARLIFDPATRHYYLLPERTAIIGELTVKEMRTAVRRSKWIVKELTKPGKGA